MDATQRDLSALGQYLRDRRGALLQRWQAAIQRDPELTSGDSLPRTQLVDHIPAILAAFEQTLLSSPPSLQPAPDTAQQPAAEHGLQRWRQGYDLREVTRELGKLNECVVAEMDAFAERTAGVSHDAMSAAHRMWAALCSASIEESVGQFFEMQQREASGHVRDLENAIEEIKQLEQQRGDLWRQAAHDLRGNLGVVANATVGLTHSGLREPARDEFVRILMRNITSLHHLLDDVTSLARLQAGRETRRIEPLDITPIIQQLCEGVRPLAQQRHLFLRCDGPPGLAADGDAVKIRRIAQNLILNAVKFTEEGGITVSWGDSDAGDSKRWVLCIQDTGPGLHSTSGGPLARALDTQTQPGPPAAQRAAALNPAILPSVREDAGEGIGLSIVKRLCEMLDATLEMKSVEGVGTSFRILFPRHYAS